MERKPMKPNILFVMVDALRADRCFGTERTVKTPTIDSLASRGVVFTQSFSTTSTTSPSVTSIFTGLYPSSHGVRSLIDYKLKRGIKTLAEILHDNGYYTYAEVTGPLLPEIGLDRGFDRYICREKDENVHSKWGESLIQRFERGEYEEPWFIFLHFWELHKPRWAPARYDEPRFGRGLYERALAGLDAYLKELLENVGEDTVVVFTADHGEKITESRLERLIWKAKKRLGYKSRGPLETTGHGFHVYDYLVRVPLILVGKGVFPANKAINLQVSHVDLLPTLVEALSLDVGAIQETDGRSLMPLIRGEPLPELPIILEACGKRLRDKSNWLTGIRTKNYKYAYSPYNDEIEEELYDLTRDSDERRNIARSEPEIARKMREMLTTRFRKAGEEFDVIGGLKAESSEFTEEEEEKILSRLKALGYIQ
jgi:arylsulfatase A-like enzyme